MRSSFKVPPRLMEVMDVAIKVINSICSKAKSHRLFRLLANEMEAQHVSLLLHTKVRWLPKCRCLHQLHVRKEIEVFLPKIESNLHAISVSNEEFIVVLAFLGDVFGHFDELNLSLQGRNVTVSDVKDKLAGLSSRMEV